MNNQGTLLKIAAMLVAIPRYVGLMLFISGFQFAGSSLIALHVAEGVAGLALAVLEGFALAYILGIYPLLESKAQQRTVLGIVLTLLITLPLCAAPYMLKLFDGSDIFAEADSTLLKFAWVTATLAMPMLIIAGVAVVEQHSSAVRLAKASHRADVKQQLQQIKAAPQQAQAAPQQSEAAPQQAESAEPAEHICPNCGVSKPSGKSLAGHLAHCKAKEKE